jgi:NAD(P)-dependent dehydrogenase (short-subunit alcohol dehydrogenase family)
LIGVRQCKDDADKIDTQYEFLRQLSADSSNTVIGTARTPSKVEEQIKKDNLAPAKNIKIFAADLDKHQSIFNVASEIATAGHKSIDYLVINGGFVSEATGGTTPTAFQGQEDLFERELTQSILTNTIGPLHTINAFLPLVRAVRAKTIIVISTGLADNEFTKLSGIAASVPYTISKAGTNVVVAKFAAELKSEDISVVALSPGLVNTDKVCHQVRNATMSNRFADTWQDSGYMAAIAEAMKPYEPEFRGAITPEQSVGAMLKVIGNDSLIKESNGTMISHLGNQRWISADGRGDEVEI